MTNLRFKFALATIIAVTSGSTLCAAAQDLSNASPATVIQHAVRELAAEAEESQKKGTPARKEPDFAAAFLSEHGLKKDSVPPHVLWSALKRSQSDDPFVDAYIRWQLTGFGAAIPAEQSLSIEEFEAFLAGLPRYLTNPRSEPAIIYRVNAALAQGNLSLQESQAMTALNDDLTLGTQKAAALNAPANRLRDWIAKQMDDRGLREHQSRLERLSARVKAGWNPEQLKRDITAALEQATNDRSFTPQQRARLAQQMKRLVGQRTAIVTRINVAENVAQAQFDEAAVYDFEVNEWIRLLQGRGN